MKYPTSAEIRATYEAPIPDDIFAIAEAHQSAGDAILRLRCLWEAGRPRHWGWEHDISELEKRHSLLGSRFDGRFDLVRDVLAWRRLQGSTATWRGATAILLKTYQRLHSPEELAAAVGREVGRLERSGVEYSRARQLLAQPHLLPPHDDAEIGVAGLRGAGRGAG